MRAVYFPEINKVVYRTDYPEPVITEDDQVKIRLKATGICGSDISGLKGGHPTRKPPIVTGHETAGVIVETGPGVKEFRVGDRVAVEPQYSCMKCPLCLSGHYNTCPEKRVLGTVRWEPGAFGEFIVAPERTLIRLPDNVSFEQGALLEPLAVGIHAADISEVREGSSVVVVGTGAIGIACMWGARAKGASKVIVIGHSEMPLEVCRQAGADVTVNSAEEDAAERVLQETGGAGADVVFMAVGTASAIDDAVRMCARQGQIMEVANFGKTGPSFENTTPFRWKELSMKGSYMYVKKDFETALAGIADGRFPTEPLITRRTPVEDSEEVFDICLHKKEKYFRMMLQF